MCVGMYVPLYVSPTIYDKELAYMIKETPRFGG